MSTETIERIQLEPGWYPDMPMAEYLAIPAMSSSGLEQLRRSPAHFREAQLHPKDPTPAMVEGTALHLALLEPHLFAGHYITLGQCEATKKGDGERCTNQGVVYRSGKSFCGVKGHDPEAGTPMAHGVHVIAGEALTRINGMKAAVLDHPQAKEFFRGRGASEVVGVWRDPATKVLCKIRLDRQIDRAGIHVDVKTTADASEEGFTRQVGRLGYHRKCAWYRRGLQELGKPAIASVLIAVETQPPHGCQTFLMDEGDLALASMEIDTQLAQYARCLEADDWPGYADGLRPLKVKPWDLPQQPSDTDWITTGSDFS